MIEYIERDATDDQIWEAKMKLERHGITAETFDICDYSGCTYREIKEIVRNAIERYGKKHQQDESGKEVNST